MTSPWQQPTPPSGQPQYGEYAPTTNNPYYAAPPAVRKGHPADVAITCVLLGIGLIVTLTTLTLPLTLAQAVSQAVSSRYGIDDANVSAVGGLALGITLSHVVLYLAGAGIAIPFMIKRRIAFWAPLAAGVVAAILFWVLLVAALLSDPRVLQAIQDQAR